MASESTMIAYGPVPSRRLGQSVGVNNIPPKICTYACIYCQLGKTGNVRIERQRFYPPEEVVEAVRRKVDSARLKDERIDYLTFVPDGEPTLDENLGAELGLLRDIGMKTAVISNASLMWMEDVREELRGADWVSLKVDTVDRDIWRNVNRPHRKLELERILHGITAFSEVFAGDLVTETMLVEGVNDARETVEATAAFLERVGPRRSYVSIPIRPPAETWVRGASEEGVNEAFQIFRDHGLETEYLIGYEGNAFAYTGNVEEDLLSIVSVHPMRKDAVESLLAKAGSEWEVVERLIEEGKLLELEYRGSNYYMRKLTRSRSGS